MLALLASPGELTAAGPFSVTLNIASLLGADFLRFDAALPTPLRGRVSVGLNPADLVADARSFQFASGFARARSYRLLLRLDTPELLHALSPALPHFDAIAVPWAAASPAATTGDSDGILEEPLTGRIVLTGCDTPDAIAWGQARGIRLFTGAAATEAALV